MTKPDKVRVTVRYLGVVRLMSGRREDVLVFTGPVTVAAILSRLKALLPGEVYQEIQRQSLLLSPRPGAPGVVLAMPGDEGQMLEDGHCLTVVTPVTGG
ncbi:hypothetical protein [Desulforamulus putei]|uniref:MoaD/ThiS family protein n=1 Tax=Desulforamulus putei DSM 12395 TaxID=1121429 RepID=A0A1M4VVH0_9FIRM|nr:hypothetical protein [Desulforamulus putei]SHE72910.1 hypothetical protein SAMN02745133_01011 [Desulforamulus putei DSM 12395]